MPSSKNFRYCVIIPVANEADSLNRFADALKRNLEKLEGGAVYFIVDTCSKDDTAAICRQLAADDQRFNMIWAPENRHVVDAYLRGYRETCHLSDYVIEMDAGFSHDPNALPLFLDELMKGYDIVYGSRFMRGGSITGASPLRYLLSKGGTWLSNHLLGMHMKDMTSGYIGMTSEMAQQIISKIFLSTAHFYQTELRFLMRQAYFSEIPIHYTAPSARMTTKSVSNALQVLFFYFYSRLVNRLV